jgi:hypothetical protein
MTTKEDRIYREEFERQQRIKQNIKHNLQKSFIKTICKFGSEQCYKEILK